MVSRLRDLSIYVHRVLSQDSLVASGSDRRGYDVHKQLGYEDGKQYSDPCGRLGMVVWK